MDKFGKARNSSATGKLPFRELKALAITSHSTNDIVDQVYKVRKLIRLANEALRCTLQ